eukprot:TRINITY_DN20499_c1_g1_i1.p1 TRINITY_DN20499_c1_g1~~TRINITY_DN20499_c1_g1_i1.p1  ORF type:complete len:1062 (-),score=120.11 TRINITY_DN20499_c1_g1_i1:103-3288(-)
MPSVDHTDDSYAGDCDAPVSANSGTCALLYRPLRQVLDNTELPRLTASLWFPRIVGKECFFRVPLSPRTMSSSSWVPRVSSHPTTLTSPHKVASASQIAAFAILDPGRVARSCLGLCRAADVHCCDCHNGGVREDRWPRWRRHLRRHHCCGRGQMLQLALSSLSSMLFHEFRVYFLSLRSAAAGRTSSEESRGGLPKSRSRWRPTRFSLIIGLFLPLTFSSVHGEDSDAGEAILADVTWRISIAWEDESCTNVCRKLSGNFICTERCWPASLGGLQVATTSTYLQGACFKVQAGVPMPWQPAKDAINSLCYWDPGYVSGPRCGIVPTTPIDAKSQDKYIRRLCPCMEAELINADTLDCGLGSHLAAPSFGGPSPPPPPPPTRAPQTAPTASPSALAAATTTAATPSKNFGSEREGTCMLLCVNGFLLEDSKLNGYYSRIESNGVLLHWSQPGDYSKPDIQLKASENGWRFLEVPRTGGVGTPLASGTLPVVAGNQYPSDEFFTTGTDGYQIGFVCCSTEDTGSSGSGDDSGKDSTGMVVVVIIVAVLSVALLIVFAVATKRRSICGGLCDRGRSRRDDAYATDPGMVQETSDCAPVIEIEPCGFSRDIGENVSLREAATARTTWDYNTQRSPLARASTTGPSLVGGGTTSSTRSLPAPFDGGGRPIRSLDKGNTSGASPEDKGAIAIANVLGCSSQYASNGIYEGPVKPWWGGEKKTEPGKGDGNGDPKQQQKATETRKLGVEDFSKPPIWSDDGGSDDSFPPALPELPPSFEETRIGRAGTWRSSPPPGGRDLAVRHVSNSNFDGGCSGSARGASFGDDSHPRTPLRFGGGGGEAFATAHHAAPGGSRSATQDGTKGSGSGGRGGNGPPEFDIGPPPMPIPSPSPAGAALGSGGVPSATISSTNRTPSSSGQKRCSSRGGEPFAAAKTATLDRTTSRCGTNGLAKSRPVTPILSPPRVGRGEPPPLPAPPLSMMLADEPPSRETSVAQTARDLERSGQRAREPPVVSSSIGGGVRDRDNSLLSGSRGALASGRWNNNDNDLSLAQDDVLKHLESLKSRLG